MKRLPLTFFLLSFLFVTTQDDCFIDYVFDYEICFDTKPIFCPEQGFLINPYTGDNIYFINTIELDNNFIKLEIYNYPLPEYLVKGTKFNNNQLLLYQRLWDIEEKECPDYFIGKIKISVPKKYIIKEIELIFSYKTETDGTLFEKRITLND